MIKRKGVCDVCRKEFELTDGSFAIRITEDNLDRSSRKWVVTILSCIENAPSEGYSHVCGKTCLFQAMDEFISKKTEECKFRIIVDNTDDDLQGHGGARSKSA